MHGTDTGCAGNVDREKERFDVRYTHTHTHASMHAHRFSCFLVFVIFVFLLFWFLLFTISVLYVLIAFPPPPPLVFFIPSLACFSIDQKMGENRHGAARNDRSALEAGEVERVARVPHPRFRQGGREV